MKTLIHSRPVTPPIIMSTISTRLEQIRQRIQQAEARYRRDAHSVTLMAVSKTKPLAAIMEAYASGQRVFGESYVLEAVDKIQTLEARADHPDIDWHFIGPIQSNKTRLIAAHFNWVHSVDRLKIAQRLNDQRPAELPPLNVCLQVNISGEASKSGLPAEELDSLAETILTLPRLRLRGLMTVPAPQTDITRQRAPFAALRALQENLMRCHSGLTLDTLSMGMTDDMEAAIAEGSTMVRIGTAIFGAREYPLRPA